MSTIKDDAALPKVAETPEQKAARKAEKKRKKSAKQLRKLEALVKSAGTDKPLRITDLNHLELAKALKDLQGGIDRVRTILAQEQP